MKIYCSGIGGIGLSAYASLQRAAGHNVSGSDRRASELIDGLRSAGISVVLEQDGSHVPADADLFVYSEAVPPDAPERRRANDLGLRSVSYFQALGELSAPFRVVAVCGTHGKSTTTAMLATAAVAAGLDPTVAVGTTVPGLGGRNWRRGGSDLFILEACEYRRSFLFLSPRIVVLTNVAGDHFDYYRSADDYERAFAEFLARLPADGTVVTHGADETCRRLAEASGHRVVDADAEPLLTLRTPGRHMQQDAQLALAAAKEIGAEAAEAASSLCSFTGTSRRGELKGYYRDIPVIDDYAHHPDEIRATLRAFRETYRDRRLVCVFQPHTHHRTLALWDGFAASFADADIVIIPNVYDARHDTESTLVDMPRFIAAIGEKSKTETLDGESLAQTKERLKTLLKTGDVLLCLGAGDITDLAAAMVSET